MPRTSLVHYINPSSISIIPNVNSSANDLAVNVTQGSKIKVCANGIERLGVNPDTNSFREWNLRGRNRCLKDPTGQTPYTIYARLQKGEVYDTLDAYIVFAPRYQYPDDNPYGLAGQWFDKHSYVMEDGLSRQYDQRGFPRVYDDPDYWWVKLGEVSAVKYGRRTLDFDTGILGTDQFNAEWYLNPDDLPLRVELSCKIDDEEVGLTPYVYWDKEAVLSAVLVKGWDDDAADRVHFWTITRSTGNEESDAAWNYPEVDSPLSDSSSSDIPDPSTARRMVSGQIALSHSRSSIDDFDAAVAATFTITAWGKNKEDEDSSDSSSSEGQSIVPLAVGIITILAETVESYELETSVATVTFNPLTPAYSPANGVTVRIRAKAQNGEVFLLTQQQIQTARLHVYYLPVDDSDSSDSDVPPELTFTNGRAVLPTSVFTEEKSINLWLENDAQVELSRTTIAYVRFGEKGDTPINCYRWYKTGVTPTITNLPRTEEPLQQDLTNASPTDGWKKNAPNRPSTGEWMLWMCNSIKHGSGIIDAWQGPVRISGTKGDPGEDASDQEYIYKRLNVYPFPSTETLPANINTGTIPDPNNPGQRISSNDKTKDDWVPTGWSDTAMPAEPDNKYVYVSIRKKAAGHDQQLGDFGTPFLWSNWGVQGIDGDGVQYIYKLFDHELNTTERTSEIPDNATLNSTTGEWMPSGTTGKNAGWNDDPLAPTTSMPFCYCSIIKKIGGKWQTLSTGKGKFEKLGLWSKWSNDAQYIYLRGTAHDQSNDVNTQLSPEVRINGGNNVATNKRGLNLVTINRQTLALVEAINYDTYGEAIGESGKTGITDLKAKLNSLDDTVFVCLVSRDAVGWDADLITLLQSFGMSDLTWSGARRSPFLFMGYKGLGKGNGLTRMRDVGAYTDFVEISVYIANGTFGTRDGAASIIASMNNQNDSISCNESGYPVRQQTVNTVLSLYMGPDLKTFIPSVKRNGTAMTIGTASNGVTVNYNASTRTLSVTYATTARIQNGKDLYEITLTADSIVRTLIFTVGGVIGDVYNLKPSVDEIVAQKDDDGYTVGGSATYYLKCGYTKNVEGVMTTVDDAGALGVVDQYYLFYRRRSRITGNWETWDGTKTVWDNSGTPMYNRYHNASSEDPSYNRSSINVNDIDAIEFFLTAEGATHLTGYATNNLTFIDSQFVPVINNGAAGHNTAKVLLYKRQMGTDDAPTTGPGIILYYKFSAKKLYTDAACTTEYTAQTPSGGGWSLQNPGQEIYKKVYVTSATAYSQEDVDDIASGEWATPVVDNDNVVATTVTIYKRTKEEPTDKPADGAVYTFASGALTGTLNGWSTAFPADNGYPCWRRHATALGSNQTDVINASEWSTPAVKVVEDGKDGLNAVSLKNFTSQWLCNNASSPAPDASSSSWGNSYIEPTDSNRFTWRKDVYEYDAPEKGRNILKGTSTPKTVENMVMSGNDGTKDFYGFNAYFMRAAWNELGLSEGDYMTISLDWSVTNAPAGAKFRLENGAAPWAPYGVTINLEAGSSNGHIENTFQVTQALAESTGAILRFRFDDATGMNFTVSNAKLEYGEFATDWCQAPEDLNHTDIYICSVYGENAIHLDLDNPHEDFLYDDAGNRKSEEAKSVIRLYNGIQQVTSGISYTIVTESDKTYGVVTNDSTSPYYAYASNGVLTVKGINANSAKVTVQATYNNKNYYASFTSNKKRQDKYDLVIAPNALSYNKSVAWTDKTIAIKANRLSINGDFSKEIALKSNNLYVSALFDKEIKAFVLRNGANNNEAYWANETPIGTNNGEWSNTSSIRGNCKTGDYFLVYGPSSDATTKYYCLIKKCTNDSGNLQGECVATVVTNGNTATITVGEKIAQENNNILVELRKSSSYNPSDASTYSVEDYDTIPINKLENGANLGENLIDGNLSPFVVDKNSSSNYDSSTRWFSGVPFKLNNDIPDNTPLSCQMRIKFEGCSNINERDVKLWLSNTTIAKYPTVVVVNTNENGTFEVKQENFTVDSRNTQGVHTGWSTYLAFGWKRYYNGASTDIDFGTNGKITIDKVKLEIGTKCTAWCLSENDKKGTSGQSSFKSFVFCRSNDTPNTPSNSVQSGYNTYNSPWPPPVSDQPTWTDGAPDGKEMLWMSSRIFTSDGQSPQQSAWSTPRHMTDTADFDVEYSSVETDPGNPANNPSNWSNTASESTIWMATRDQHNGTWSDWNVIKVKGETGPASTVPGPAGGNTATIYLYKRGTSVDDVWGKVAKRPQIQLYYSFADRKLYTTETGTTSPSSSQLGGWSETIPEGSNPLYVTVAIAYANTARDVINNGEWVSPSRMVENGSQGVHGFNSATVFLYRRSDTADVPLTNNDRPTGTFKYTFATGVLTANSGASLGQWTQNIPSGANPCYVIQAAALSQEDTDNDVHEWSDVVKLVENGAKGNDSTVHWLVPTPSSVNFKSNTVGDFSGSATVVCKVWKKVGDNAEAEVAASSGKYDGFYLYYKIHRMTGDDNPTLGNSKTITWQEAVYGAVVSGGTNTNPVSSIEFILSTSSTGSGVAASNTIASASCPVTTDGRRGAVGATGKMFYSMGPWDDTYASYSRSGDLVPLVYYDGAYWYVKDGVTGNVPTGSAPSTSSQYWQKAEQYGVVITEGIFADFAKLGKAIVSGDYEFSMNGYIGDTQYVSGALWKGVPAYTLFCGDPADKAFSYSGTKTLSTSFASLNDNPVTVSKDETRYFVLKVGSLTGRTQISIFSVTSSVAQFFNYSTSATDNTWTSVDVLELSANTTYYISFTAAITYGYFIKAKAVSGTVYMQFELTSLLFEPNWWVDLLTGKMSASKGNFVVDPNGDVHIKSGDVDISGTIRAKNLYHNVFVFMEGTYRSSADAKSGDADIILMVPKADNWNTGAEYRTVKLPNPANYPGKLIEISILYYGSSGYDAIIGCEETTRFFDALQLYNDGGSIKNNGGSSDVLAYSGGTNLKLVSMYVNTQYENKYYWVLISKMDVTGGYDGTQTIGTKTIKVSNGLVKEIS